MARVFRRRGLFGLLMGLFRLLTGISRVLGGLVAEASAGSRVSVFVLVLTGRVSPLSPASLFAVFEWT